jgi:UDP-N-acetylglucosamine--N-acetylmuramyl-(pentapeptide) pyrophosphoryl-undecaprenol N-acetylglucosamine transferase
LANRIIFRYAATIALSFEESRDELARRQRSRAIVTGNPVRPILLDGKAERAISFFDLSKEALPVIYITGGALGSRILNEAVLESLPRLLSACRIIHQCGKQPLARQRLLDAASALPENLRRRYAVTEFVGDEIGDIYALADMVLGRSGAGTVSEVCAVGKAALFVPLVPTGGDEQTRNALRVVNAGGAVILPQKELTADTLAARVQELTIDRDRLIEMGRRSKTLARPNAAKDLAEAVIALGKK